MTCHEVIDLLTEYAAEELSPERRCHCDEHFRDCPDCAVFFATFQVTIRIGRALPPLAPPTSLLDRLRAALGAQA